MNNQEILDNAPSGAEYISKIGYLWNDGDSWFVYEVATEEWLHLFFHEHDELELNIRSLADIKRIAELEEYKSYYKELVSTHGYDGITQLLVADTKNKERIVELETALESVNMHGESCAHELENANKRIAELEEERDELKVVVSYLDTKITSASNCHERATPFLLDDALNRTHLDFHREALKESK